MYTAILIIAANIAGLFLIYYLVRREIKRMINPRDILSEIENDIQSVLTELNNATDRDVTIIEEATERLKKVIEEADKRIRVLEKAGSRRQIDEYTNLKPAVIPKKIPDPVPEKKIEKAQEPDKRDQVLLLFRQGFNPPVIAKRLGMPLGEVELIISLGSA